MKYYFITFYCILLHFLLLPFLFFTNFCLPFQPFISSISISINHFAHFFIIISLLSDLDFLQAKTELGWEGSTHKLLTMVRKVNKAEPAKGDVQKWYEQYIALGLDQKPFDSTEDDAIIKSLDAASA